MEELVSIIVPVYNTSCYLEKCIESILNQKYNNFELIMVNDGSTDNSLEICKKYESLENVYVFDIVNQGVSHARNYGLKNAKGKYVVFVDSDDAVSPFYISSLMSAQKAYCNSLTVCGYTRDDADLFINNEENTPKYIRYDDTIRTILDNDHICGYLFNKIFDREIIIKNDIEFDERISLYEDLYFILEYSKCVDSVVYFESKIYFYRNTENSLSKAPKKITERTLTSLWGLENLAKFILSNKSDDTELVNRSCNRLITQCTNFYVKLIFSNLDSKTKKKWKNTIYLLISRYKKYFKRNKNNNLFKLIVLSYLKIKSTYKVKGRT